MRSILLILAIVSIQAIPSPVTDSLATDATTTTTSSSSTNATSFDSSLNGSGSAPDANEFQNTFKNMVQIKLGLVKLASKIKVDKKALDVRKLEEGMFKLETLSSTAEAIADMDDPCTFLGSHPSYSAAVACLNFFPYSAELKQHTVGVIRKALAFNVFYDLAMNPPDPSFVKPYNVNLALDVIDKKEDWQNDREWQEALMDAFIPLGDGHSVFQSYCYSRLVFKQPFLPIARMDAEDRTRIYVGAVASVAGDDDFDYLGREIIEIDGKPVLQALTDYANWRIGGYKDPATRFNDLFATKTWTSSNGWLIIPGKYASRSRVPRKKSKKYTFAPKTPQGQPEVVEQEWKVILPADKPFSNSYEYLRNFCFDEDSTSDEFVKWVADTAVWTKDQERAQKGKVFQSKKVDILRNPVLHPHAVPDKLATMDNNGNLPSPIAGDNGVALYLTSNKKVAVLVIPTFKYNNDFNKASWRTDMAVILDKIKQKKISKLIIDLTGNGGGNVCLASELNAALLQSSSSKTFPDIPTNRLLKDQRMTEAMQLLVDTAVDTNQPFSSFHPGAKLNPATGERFIGKEMVTPLRQHPQLTQQYSKSDNPPSMYSQYFDHYCVKEVYNPLAEINLGLSASNIAIVSSGNCGSACALLYHSLREFGGAKSFAIGYRKDKQRSIAAFPGGEYFQLDEIHDEMDDLGLYASENPVLPEHFQINAFYSMPIREAYSSKKPGMPLEYMYVPAEHMINIDEELWFRPDLVWERVVQISKWDGCVVFTH